MRRMKDRKMAEFERSQNSQHIRQQKALDEIAAKYGVVAYRPDYYGKDRDANTVLFYMKEDDDFNREVDRRAAREGTRGYSRSEARDLKWVPDYLTYKDYFWSFSNEDQNGYLNLDYANLGKIDLRSPNWRDKLEGHVRLALAKWMHYKYIASIGGYWELGEADDHINDLSREKIAAMKMIYGDVYLTTVNFYDEKRERIVAGEESIYEEVGDPEDVCNFSGSYCVPTKDPELEELILAWNRSDEHHLMKDAEKITDRVNAIGGIYLVWT